MFFLRVQTRKIIRKAMITAITITLIVNITAACEMTCSFKDDCSFKRHFSESRRCKLLSLGVFVVFFDEKYSEKCQLWHQGSLKETEDVHFFCFVFYLV